MTMDNATVGNTNEKNGEETSTSPRRERCTGLHQTNFNPANPLQFSSSALNEHDERTIVSVFRQFRDHCVLRLKDGMTKSSQNLNKQKNSEIHDTKDKEETGDFTNSVTESAESLTSVKSDDAVQLDHLPFYCKLIVLSKLETSDISHLSMTSRHWREVCSDQILWRELLCRDIVKWSNIGLRSFPLLSDWLEVVYRI